MSTTHMPFSTVAESFSDAFTGLMGEATHITRVSTNTYLTGLDAIVEQQRLARENSRQWMSEIVSVQSDLGQQFARSYSASSDRVASAAAESTDAAESANTNLARSARPRRASSKRTQAATPRRTSRQAATSPPPAAPASVTVAGLKGDRYDSLTAVEVIEKLPGFSQRDLRELETYETAHQARQTVLQRVESLRGTEPIAGYDELTVPEVHAQLTDGDEARARSVRDYERSHKNRDGVLQAAQARIDNA